MQYYISIVDRVVASYYSQALLRFSCAFDQACHVFLDYAVLHFNSTAAFEACDVVLISAYLLVC